METRDALACAATEEEYALERLHHWLRYEGLTGLLGGGALWLPYGLVLTVLVGLAAVFTPYMLWQLGKAGWYGSIAVFAVLIFVPLTASLLVEAEASVGYYALRTGPLVLFYLYTWGLRHVIGEHLSESHAVRRWEYDQRRHAL